MNKSILLILCLGFAISFNLTAQERQVVDPAKSPFQKITTKIGVIEVTLEYSRPSMRGRKIFGELTPFNKIWRTGANINTKITFGNKVSIEGYELAAGSYTIFTRPNTDQWEIYFHKELSEYGAPDTLDMRNVVAKALVKPIQLNRTIETLTINFDNLTNNSAVLGIAWENTYIPIPIKAITEKALVEKLALERKNLMDDYRAAANIYLEVEGNGQKALEAIDQSITLLLNGQSLKQWLKNADLSDRHLPNKHRIKSLALAQLGKYKEAIKVAKISLKIAKLVKDDFYTQQNLKNIEKWKKMKK